MAYGPIKFAKNRKGGNSMPVMLRAPEAASQTFRKGVPLSLVNGFVQEVSFAANEKVYGISAEAGHSLTAAGVPREVSEATPPNQPSAVTTPVGAWIRDGRCALIAPTDDAIFLASLATGQVFSQALVKPDTRYALLKDGTTGYWYVDSSNTGTDPEHAALIVGGDDNDNTMVNIVIASAARAGAW